MIRELRSAVMPMTYGYNADLVAQHHASREVATTDGGVEDPAVSESLSERVRRRLAERVKNRSKFARGLDMSSPASWANGYFEARKYQLRPDLYERAASLVGLTLEQLVGPVEPPLPGSKSTDDALIQRSTPESGTASATLATPEGRPPVPTTDHEWLLDAVRLVRDPAHVAELNRLVGEIIGREARHRENKTKSGP